MDRTDAFEVALAALRERLREGVFAPGTRIPASKLADALKLSATPVREALCRLAGEGLVEERRQQGFFVRTLTGVDIADLYRLSLSHLLMVHGQNRTGLNPRRTAPSAASASQDPVRAVEDLFVAWMGEVASTSLMASYRTLVIQLGPVRRVEAEALDDLEAEANELLDLQAPDHVADRPAALRRFYTRRVAIADRLASALGRPDSAEKI
jgi:DNA-binding transcriptional MocR family regulator